MSEIKLLRITDENRHAVLEVVASSYLKDKCGICGDGFTREQINAAVWCPSNVGRIAHDKCYHIKEGK